MLSSHIAPDFLMEFSGCFSFASFESSWCSSGLACEPVTACEYCPVMWNLTADNARQYLIDAGHLPATTQAVVKPLAWGVSNVVLRVDPEQGSPLVLKQSQPQLRTKIDWFSRCERIYREADVLRALATRLPVGAVPAVRFEDRPNYILGLEAIRPDHVVWKQQLLAGELDEAVAARLGWLLGLMHGTTAGHPELLPDSEDWSLFDELRIDPFYRFLARRDAELVPMVDRLLDEMSRHRVCLVHADFSPKNVLVHPGGVALVDFETGHWGDPAFDLGFFLAHLLLKSLRPAAPPADWQRLIDRFWSAYCDTLQGIGTFTDMKPGVTSSRAVWHLAACLQARIDGKSPVDYLTEAWQAEFVRTLTRRWLADPPDNLAVACTAFLHRE
uniref:Phosphotransferase n=1 Tax=Schlesneria paludicola TaxID=360056 RepID=A0A7C2JXM6_9PLAN